MVKTYSAWMTAGGSAGSAEAEPMVAAHAARLAGLLQSSPYPG